MIDIETLAAKGSFERQLLDEIDLAKLPRHVAIIMDGNGRWAKQRGSPRVEGHRAGIASVRETVETCARLELDALTLYAFSVENWKRPRFEIVTLMSLLKEYLAKELGNLLKNDIRFRVVGRMNELDPSVQKALAHGLAATSSCRGMTFNIALNYGGRTEIVDACRSLANDVASGRLTPEQIDEETLGSRLSTAGLPDPDLLIRTSGEMRVSNFLLWQIAYSEIWVTPTLWPDFRKRHLFEAILDFQKRERRYGGVIEGRAPDVRGRRPEGVKRELAAAVAIPIVLAVLFLGPPLLFNVLVAAIALGAVWEFYRIAEKTGHPVAKTVGPRGVGAAPRRSGPALGAAALRDARPATSWRSSSSRGRASGTPPALVTVFLAAVAPMASHVPPVERSRGRGRDDLRRRLDRAARGGHVPPARRARRARC